MSFYGSVYYQLVDTFNKVVAKNALNGTQFPEVQDGNQELQAFGRINALNLANGNKWINFTVNDGFLEIWHGKPDSNANTRVTGYEFLGPEPNLPQDTIITELQPGDVFSTFTAKCDNAGHLVTDEIGAKYFRMPRSETEKEIAILKEQVGTPKTETTAATGMFLTNDTQDTALKDHETRVIALEDVYGKDIYESAQAFFPSTYWDVNEYTSSGGKYQCHEFPTAFGSIDDIRKTYFGAEDSKETVSTVLTVKIPERFGAIESHVSILDGYVDNLDDIATNARDTINETIIPRLDELDANYKEADTALGTRINGVISNYEQADTALGTRIDTVITNYTKADTDMTTRVDAIEAAYKAADKDLGTRIDAVSNGQAPAIASAIELAKTTITAEYQAADATVKSELLEKINKNAGDIATLSGTQTTVGAQVEALSTSVTNITREGGLLEQSLAPYSTKDIELSNKITALESGATTTAADIASLKEKDTGFDTAVQTLRSDVDGCIQAHTAINTSISGLQASVANIPTLTSDVDKLKTSVGVPANEENNVVASGIYAILAEIQTQLTTLSNQINALDEKVTILEGYHTENLPSEEN